MKARCAGTVGVAAGDGDEHDLRAECAREGRAARDAAAIDAALSPPCPEKTEDGPDV